MILEIPFHQFDHNFCESTIYSTERHPEYLNTVSSLFITFIGLNALFRKHQLSIFLTIMYSCLAVNGVLSFLYHYYNSIGYGLLDRMSMVLLGLSTSYVCYTTIKNLVFTFGFFVDMLIHLSIVAYYSFLLTIAGLHKEVVFNTLFTVFLASIALYVYVVRKHVERDIISLGWKGVRYIFASAIFWITTEGLCGHFFFIKYLFGHVWWHVFVSYGGYLVSIVPQYIILQRTKKEHEKIEIYYDVFGLPYLDYVKIFYV
jgi:hypothetical protein